MDTGDRRVRKSQRGWEQGAEQSSWMAEETESTRTTGREGRRSSREEGHHRRRLSPSVSSLAALPSPKDSVLRPLVRMSRIWWSEEGC